MTVTTGNLVGTMSRPPHDWKAGPAKLLVKCFHLPPAGYHIVQAPTARNHPALVSTVHKEGDDVPDAHIGARQEAQEPDQEHHHVLCGS